MCTKCECTFFVCFDLYFFFSRFSCYLRSLSLSIVVSCWLSIQLPTAETKSAADLVKEPTRKRKIMSAYKPYPHTYDVCIVFVPPSTKKKPPRTLCSDFLYFSLFSALVVYISSENKFMSYFRFYFSFESKSDKEKKNQPKKTTKKVYICEPFRDSFYVAFKFLQFACRFVERFSFFSLVLYQNNDGE